MDPPLRSESLIGRVFGVDRGRTQGIGIVVDDLGGGTVRIHTSQDVTFDIDSSQLHDPSGLVPMWLSPPARLLWAARQPVQDLGTDWDQELLRRQAGTVALRNYGALRAFVDDALHQGLGEILDWAPLTDFEKTWRRCHHAASSGRSDELLTLLHALPDTGYEARVDLVVTNLPQLVDRPDLSPMVARWVMAGMPRAGSLQEVLDDHHDLDAALVAGLRLLSELLPADATRWSEPIEDLRRGAPSRAITPGAQAWDAASVVNAGRMGANIDGAFNRVRDIEISLLDDLVDAGALTADAPIHFADAGRERYLRARLAPELLSEHDLALLPHPAESARRAWIADVPSGSVPSSIPLEHALFSALRDYLTTGRIDRTRLDPEAAEMLEEVERVEAALASGATSTVSATILGDVTTWARLAEHARSNRIRIDEGVRRQWPAFARWCDAQRLLGLLWQERWTEAIDLGNALMPCVEGAMGDEVRSLMAFAYLGLGQLDRAFERLAPTTSGGRPLAYSINLAVAASDHHPRLAETNLLRVASRATDNRERIAALERAALLYLVDDRLEAPSMKFEQVTGRMLIGCAVADELHRVVLIARAVVPHTLLACPALPGSLGRLLQLEQSFLRFEVGERRSGGNLVSAVFCLAADEAASEWFAEFRNRLLAEVVAGLVADRAVKDSLAVAKALAGGRDDLFDRRQRRTLSLPIEVVEMRAVLASGRRVDPDAVIRNVVAPARELLEESATPAHAFPLAVEVIGELLLRLCYDLIEQGVGRCAREFNARSARLASNSGDRDRLLWEQRDVLQQAGEEQDAIDELLVAMDGYPYGADSDRLRLALRVELSDWQTETRRLGGGS